MATLRHDLRHAARRLAARPALTVTTVLVLALGLGATAALFSLVNGLLLKGLPGVEEPHRLVLVGRTTEGEGFDTFGYPEYLELAEAESLSGLVAEDVQGVELRTGSGARWATAGLVTGNYFSVLGAPAAAGRLLQPADTERTGEAPVAVLAHRTATELFGSPAAAEGRTVEVNGIPLRVVGVTGEGFQGHSVLERIDVWTPLTLVQQIAPPPFPVDVLAERGLVFLKLFGRLAPKASPVGAETELRGIFSRVREQYPDAYEGRGVTVVEGFGLSPGVRSYVRGLSAKLLGLVALVLIVVCANVANLQLARISDRRQELGIRLALGASRRSLVRQVLVESLLVALLGGAAGLLVAAWSGELLTAAVGATPLSYFGTEALSFAPDVRVFAFAFGLALVAGFVAGAAPALVATRSGAEAHLRQGGGSRGTDRSLLRDGLVVGQIGLSLVLLALAGLHLRSVASYRQIDPGFDVGRVWAAGVRVGGEASEGRTRAVLGRLAEKAEAVPGVDAAALGRPLPLAGSRMSTVIQVPGREPPPERSGFQVDFRDVSPGYFRTLGLTVLRGRGFEEGDGPDASRVAVVNQTMAERLWPGESPVGKTFTSGLEGEVSYRVVGVVSDMKYLALDEEPRLHLYRPLSQNPAPETMLHVRAASGDPAAAGLAVEKHLAETVPEAVLFDGRTLAAQLDRSIGTVRVAASAISLFGLLALVLTAAGLAGTLLYYVRTHLHEIGVRMALGADARRLVLLICGRSLRRSLLGLSLGVPVAWAAAEALGQGLYGVDPGDPWLLIGVAAVLLATALAAAFPAAARARGAEPAEVLRQE